MHNNLAVTLQGQLPGPLKYLDSRLVPMRCPHVQIQAKHTRGKDQ